MDPAYEEQYYGQEALGTIQLFQAPEELLMPTTTPQVQPRSLRCAEDLAHLQWRMAREDRDPTASDQTSLTEGSSQNESNFGEGVVEASERQWAEAKEAKRGKAILQQHTRFPPPDLNQNPNSAGNESSSRSQHAVPAQQQATALGAPVNEVVDDDDQEECEVKSLDGSLDSSTKTRSLNSVDDDNQYMRRDASLREEEERGSSGSEPAEIGAHVDLDSSCASSIVGKDDLAASEKDLTNASPVVSENENSSSAPGAIKVQHAGSSSNKGEPLASSNPCIIDDEVLCSLPFLNPSLVSLNSGRKEWDSWTVAFRYFDGTPIENDKNRTTKTSSSPHSVSTSSRSFLVVVTLTLLDFIPTLWDAFARAMVDPKTGHRYQTEERDFKDYKTGKIRKKRFDTAIVLLPMAIVSEAIRRLSGGSTSEGGGDRTEVNFSEEEITLCQDGSFASKSLVPLLRQDPSLTEEKKLRAKRRQEEDQELFQDLFTQKVNLKLPNNLPDVVLVWLKKADMLISNLKATAHEKGSSSEKARLEKVETKFRILYPKSMKKKWFLPPSKQRPTEKWATYNKDKQRRWKKKNHWLRIHSSNPKQQEPYEACKYALAQFIALLHSISSRFPRMGVITLDDIRQLEFDVDGESWRPLCFDEANFPLTEEDKARAAGHGPPTSSRPEYFRMITFSTHSTKPKDAFLELAKLSEEPLKEALKGKRDRWFAPSSKGSSQGEDAMDLEKLVIELEHNPEDDTPQQPPPSIAPGKKAAAVSPGGVGKAGGSKQGPGQAQTAPLKGSTTHSFKPNPYQQAYIPTAPAVGVMYSTSSAPAPYIPPPPPTQPTTFAIGAGGQYEMIQPAGNTAAVPYYPPTQAPRPAGLSSSAAEPITTTTTTTTAGGNTSLSRQSNSGPRTVPTKFNPTSAPFVPSSSSTTTAAAAALHHQMPHSSQSYADQQGGGVVQGGGPFGGGGGHQQISHAPPHPTLPLPGSGGFPLTTTSYSGPPTVPAARTPTTTAAPTSSIPPGGGRKAGSRPPPKSAPVVTTQGYHTSFGGGGGGGVNSAPTGIRSANIYEFGGSSSALQHHHHHHHHRFSHNSNASLHLVQPNGGSFAPPRPPGPVTAPIPAVTAPLTAVPSASSPPVATSSSPPAKPLLPIPGPKPSKIPQGLGGEEDGDDVVDFGIKGAGQQPSSADFGRAEDDSSPNLSAGMTLSTPALSGGVIGSGLPNSASGASHQSAIGGDVGATFSWNFSGDSSHK